MQSKKTKIVIIGDFSINQYYYGKIKNIAKDAPIPITEVSKVEKSPGMSSIITEELKKFGINVVPIGMLGNDDDGKWLKNYFSKLKIPTSGLIMDSKIITPITSRVIVDDQQVFRFDENKIIEKIKNWTKLLVNFRKHLKTTNLVILSDYGLGTLNEKLVEEVIKECQSNKINIFISSTGFNYFMFKNSNVISKINMKNAMLLTNKSGQTIHSSNKICKNLEKILGWKRILLTKGKDGIAIYENGLTIEKLATQNKIVDIKEIGEIMIAATTMSLFKNKDFEESCTLGNIAAGLAATKGNIQQITKRDLFKAKNEYEEWLEQK